MGKRADGLGKPRSARSCCDASATAWLPAVLLPLTPACWAAVMAWMRFANASRSTSPDGPVCPFEDVVCPGGSTTSPASRSACARAALVIQSATETPLFLAHRVISSRASVERFFTVHGARSVCPAILGMTSTSHRVGASAGLPFLSVSLPNGMPTARALVPRRFSVCGVLARGWDDRRREAHYGARLPTH